jgi:hypothetical protein
MNGIEHDQATTERVMGAVAEAFGACSNHTASHVLEAVGDVVPASDLRGAVDALREVARLLDRSTQTGKAPTGDEWAALTLANATLDRFGGR